MSKKLESEDEDKFVYELAVRASLIGLKFEVQGEKGYPDRMILGPKRFICFVEFKRQDRDGGTSAHQDQKIKELNDMGFPAAVFNDWKEAVKWVLGHYEDWLHHMDNLLVNSHWRKTYLNGEFVNLESQTKVSNKSKK